MITAILLLITTIILIFLSIFLFIRSKNSSDKLKKISSQEKNKLISVMSSLTDGVIVLDNNFIPWAINNAARSFLSITKQSTSFEDISAPFSQEVNLKEKLKEAIKFDRTVTLHEVIINNKTFRIYINPVGDRKEIQASTNQDIIGVSLLLQDVTSEKSVEKTKEEFSHAVVHELRAPVAAIKDSASLMITGGLGEDDQKKMLNLIHDQSKKLLTQISSILDSAKVEDGKLALIKTPGEIGKVVRDEISLFLPEAKKKNITLIAEVGNNLPIISFDNVKITQAITNIISNSLKYTNENGVIKITVDTDEEYDRTKSQGMMVITVSDNGIGIPPEKQQMLFTKFGQFNSNSNKETQAMSSGLGLYITKGIVEAHGGRISVRSTVNKGTTVTFTIPIIRESNKPGN